MIHYLSNLDISTQVYHNIQPVTLIQPVKEAQMNTFFSQGYENVKMNIVIHNTALHCDADIPKCIGVP